MSRTKSIGGAVLLGLLGLLVLTVLFLPTMQNILYALVVANPALLYWTFIGLVISGVVYAVKPNFAGSAVPVIMAFSVVFMGLMVGPWLSGVYAHGDMADQFSPTPRIWRNCLTLPKTMFGFFPEP